ncbi:MAG: 1-acyl-sn-glycerol-3-phosphate acyltransferase [Gallionellales bacterium 35-53-114]|jgi:1-acyl-sn-glycerol-3-phosphate acyltransferase|nr:MAG: 1-acyl-sn-glycerol-3-phosphate acyltransferase [Gallionellales bacterium 35-53-114]OYZ63738.1 MAG: 1-acyl-sn-glycerol-3-phosphate acyltransferase [Gallionellales bacterium 24-53-125]OZB09430.1 MAG: 1-acyl-sn-glycerol-3-phosphate acyltransferase [Gallionellales bacterium 39-52-133]HQS57911.1 lysophospholipid acyltransferase family protein [Gallionellaceae bacterium]HQS76072.1 lysophospholipid acyltransferase family protein [Gallionellaceae bacterium]
MVFIRSFIFALFQLLITPVFTLLAILSFPFHPITRYRIISGWALSVMWLLRVLCGIRMEVRGAENIPATPAILLCKHQSAWETIALQKVFPPQVWVLKRELLWLPFFGWGLAMTSPIAIKRSDGKGAVRQLLKQGKERLDMGFFVVIFPEGTRIPYGQRGKYKIGGALLSASTGVPVVPIAHNAGKLWGRNSFLKRPGVITMSIGAPINPDGLKAEEINRRAEEWIEAEVKRIN